MAQKVCHARQDLYQDLVACQEHDNAGGNFPEMGLLIRAVIEVRVEHFSEVAETEERVEDPGDEGAPQDRRLEDNPEFVSDRPQELRIEERVEREFFHDAREVQESPALA